MALSECLFFMPGLAITKYPDYIRSLPYQYASESISGLEKGGRIIGLTKGQFSLVDLIVACLDIIGPSDVILSTWAAGLRDAKVMKGLLSSGKINSFLMLCDRSFSSRHEKYARSIQDIFGKECIRTTNTHAKFVLLKSSGWDITIKTSMNLNHNPRFETFDIDDSQDIYNFFKGHVDEMFLEMPEGFTETRRIVSPVFNKSLKDQSTSIDNSEFQFTSNTFSW